MELSNSLRRKNDQKTRNNEGQDVLTLKKGFDDLKATNVQLQSTVIELEDYADVLFDQNELNITIILGLKKVQNIFKPRLHVYEPEKSSGTKL